MPRINKKSSQIKKPESSRTKNNGKVTTSTSVHDRWNLYHHGITTSLLHRFIVCRHRFSLLMFGLVKETHSSWKPALIYGSWFHELLDKFCTLQQKYQSEDDRPSYKQLQHLSIQQVRETLVRETLKEFPADREDILHWWEICSGQFQVYCDHFETQETQRSYLDIERTFCYNITLPSGRIIPYRGKIDCSYQINRSEVWQQESKTKGSKYVNSTLASRVPTMIQPMIYGLVLQSLYGRDYKGVVYNCIVRPQSEFYPLRQKKSETPAEFRHRIVQQSADKPEDYFHPFEVPIRENHVTLFKNEILYPWLEQLADWYDYMTTSGEVDPYRPTEGYNPHHFRTPYGIYNSLFEGFTGDYWDYMTKGSVKGLQSIQLSDLFSELNEDD